MLPKEVFPAHDKVHFLLHVCTSTSHPHSSSYMIAHPGLAKVTNSKCEQSVQHRRHIKKAYVMDAVDVCNIMVAR